jgi:putative DNA primase/helicase
VDNYHDVLHQMEQFGIELQSRDSERIRDLPGSKFEGRRTTCGAKGKDWFKFYIWRPQRGGELITGSFGTYRHGGSYQKVVIEHTPVTDAERADQARQREEQRAAAAKTRAEEVANAAADAVQLWRRAAREGRSPYLDARGLVPESCRFLDAPMVLRWTATRAGEDDTVVRLPEGTLVIPMLRFDKPRHEALRGLQFVRPDGGKVYQRGFEKPGCAVRLGQVTADDWLALVCEGYATGLALRMAFDQTAPVFVAFDAGNLEHVVPLLRELYPGVMLLICADDDWKTRDRRTGELTNPGRTTARKVARKVNGCDFVYPAFDLATRQERDTDFDDLRRRQGLDVVRRQLDAVTQAMARAHAR